MFRVKIYDNIVSTFESLMSDINALANHIETTDPFMRISDGLSEFQNSKSLAIEAIQNVYRDFTLSPQETNNYIGGVSSDKYMLEIVSNINQKKLQLKNLTQTFKENFSKHNTKPIRDLLSTYNSHINLKHLFRCFRIIDIAPMSISWSKCISYSNVKISKQQALDMLDKLGTSLHIQIQIEKLHQLRDDIVLIKRREIKPSWVANVMYFDDSNKRKHIKITSSMPIFYRGSNQINTKILFAKKSVRAPSIKRSDMKIENTPYLKSINVYKYRENI